MRLLLVGAIAVASVAQPNEDLRSLVRDSLAFLDPARDGSREYAFTWRTERKRFDSSGKVTSSESIVRERIFVDGVFAARVLEKNGRRLSEQELRRDEDIIRTRIAAERQEYRKKNTRDDEWLKEIPDALEFRHLRDELLSGRPTAVLACSPRPGYSARNMRARVFEKTNGTLWIDRQERQLVRADAEVTDTVNIGFGIIGRVEKGTRFQISRMCLPEGAWVTQRQTIRFGARMLLVKWIGSAIETSYSNYRHKSEIAGR